MSSLIVALAMSWGAWSGSGRDSAVVESSDRLLDRWVDRAISSHPEAQSARWAVQAAEAAEPGGRAWMPPTSQLTYQSDGRVDFSLSQMVPGFGKTSAQAEVRSRKTAMVRIDSAERIRKLSLAVREAAWMEWMAWQKVRVLSQQDSAWERWSRALERTQAQGMGAASETWIVRAKGVQARAELAKARADAEAATAMREGWTGFDSLRMVALPATPPDWDSLALLDASGSRADIATMEADAAMQRAMAGSMRASLRPDFMVGAMAMRMTDGMPGWGVMAGMTLPFAPWSASMATSEAGASEASARAAEASAQAMRRMAKSEAQGHSRRAIAAWNALRENDSLVLPGLRRAVEDARTRYAQGREMLSMVLSMEDMVRMSAMQEIMFRGEYELERIRLLAAAPVGFPANRGGK